ncbi:MAG: cation-transporting P-type ATPase, partial [Candidatus Margulisiibacteriota bacterium]
MLPRIYALTIEKAADTLRSDAVSGLTAEEARRRLDEFGENRLKGKKGPGPLLIFIGQFRDLIIWILIVAALVSGFLKEWIDAGAIVAIVVLNAILGFIQEWRAERSLAALKKLSSPTSRVVRDGNLTVIQSFEL